MGEEKVPDGPVFEGLPMGVREFCGHQRRLIEGMAMRKKRNVQMQPIQAIKLSLLAYLEEADPLPGRFSIVLSQAVGATSEGGATGPAQAVASDLLMDWEMVCSSPVFAHWLRTTSVEGPREGRGAGDGRRRDAKGN